MKISFLSLAFLSITACIAQRSLPLRYIPIDSISTVPNGTDVKLDFKTKKRPGNGSPPHAYPWLVDTKYSDGRYVGDTVMLIIDAKPMQFVELKGKTVDFYAFNLEHLESTEMHNGRIITITSASIKEIAQDSVLFRLSMEILRPRRHRIKLDYQQEKDLWIQRKDLDGVLYRIEDHSQ